MLTFGEGRILFWEGASLWVLAAGPEVGEAGVKGTFANGHAGPSDYRPNRDGAEQ